MDQPNWRPGETSDEYLANCREGLEDYSDRRFAKLMGWPCAHLHRVKLTAAIPDDLFDKLLGAGCLSVTALSDVGAFLSGAGIVKEIERCPHCREALRVRRRMSKPIREIVRAWLRERYPS
jgi:hypothetical protein